MALTVEVPHSPADDCSVDDYARGVVSGVMEHATPNAVASLIARIHDDRRSIAALLPALRKAGVHVCSLLCPSVKRTRAPWKHEPLCREISAAVEQAEGAKGRAEGR